MTLSANKAPEALLQRLRQANRLLLVSHQSPDGDAIGSELALARILRRMGKGATVWNRDAAPAIFKPLAGFDRIHVGSEPPAGFPETFDAVVVLECPGLDRTGLAEQLGSLPLLNIDHHLGNGQYGEVNWVDTAAPAVGEMIFRLAQGLHAELDAETANALLLTIAADTGGFRFSNTGVAAFEAAAALVRHGASPEQVSLWLYESQPLASLRLLGEMLTTLELAHDGRVATVALTPAMYAAAGATAADSEGLIDHPRSIAGVVAVALLRELPDGRAKVSLRSKGDVDIERLARQYGGGGHRNAAGFTVERNVGELRTELIAALGQAAAG
jgi:phosphoesterase RecJ-like protein